MSIVFSHENNVLLCHSTYINKIYDKDAHSSDDPGTSGDQQISVKIKECIFNLNVPFSKKNSEESSRNRKAKKKKANIAENENRELQSVIDYISNGSATFLKLCNDRGILPPLPTNSNVSNSESQSFLDYFRTESTFSKSIDRLHGENSLSHSIVTTIDDTQFIIPPKCKFFNRDVRDLAGIDLAREYNLIVIDPPWWNKYIRRTRNKQKDYGYEMLTNDDIKSIPIENLTTANVTLVAIWCTNSPTLMQTIISDFLPKWNLKLVATWYWLKITKHGETICEFNIPLMKQPFEQLFIACHTDTDLASFQHIDDRKILYSVPSIIHSQKPPLTELLLGNTTSPDDINCLEIFARYLLPNYTSIGLEALKLQNMSLFQS